MPAIVVMAYLAFGLLLIDFMCPLWHPFEKLLGAVLWPISAAIGIWMFLKSDVRDTRLEEDLLLLHMAMALDLAARKKQDSDTPEGR